MPPWDFDAPTDENSPRPVPNEVKQSDDSSAAAIAASGLLDLSAQTDVNADSQRYRQAALQILEALCGPAYLAQSEPAWEGILLHGVYHYHKNLGVDESVAWGDFFFVEALEKAVASGER